MKSSGMSPETSGNNHFFVNVEYTYVKIVAGDIDYIEGLKDYIKIYLSSNTKPVLTRMSQKSVEAKRQLVPLYVLTSPFSWQYPRLPQSNEALFAW